MSEMKIVWEASGVVRNVLSTQTERPGLISGSATYQQCDLKCVA